MTGRGTIRVIGTAALVLGLAALAQPRASAQRGAGAAQKPASPQAAAPIDITGYWVSVVNEDWRWRMVTPPKGDYASVPLNEAGRKMADTWDTSKDGSCLAYGAPGLMRMPGRLHITWENESIVKIETDAGQQTRRLIFGSGQPAPAPRSLQGHSVAEWELPGRGARGGAATGTGRGSLKVVTTNLRAGWLRRNGVPYSENAVLTEYFDRFPAPNGDEWLVVTSVVADPQYLTQDFVTSTHFKREPDGAKWRPSACKG